VCRSWSINFSTTRNPEPRSVPSPPAPRQRPRCSRGSSSHLPGLLRSKQQVRSARDQRVQESTTATLDMACCKSGSAVIGHHPQGSLRTLGPIECYFSLTSTRSRGTVLVLPDGFGLALHNKLLADKFAAQGWNAIIPDYFQGHLPD
jgi:hypothetical protein